MRPRWTHRQPGGVRPGQGPKTGRGRPSCCRSSQSRCTMRESDDGVQPRLWWKRRQEWRGSEWVVVVVRGGACWGMAARPSSQAVGLRGGWTSRISRTSTCYFAACHNQPPPHLYIYNFILYIKMSIYIYIIYISRGSVAAVLLV